MCGICGLYSGSPSHEVAKTVAAMNAAITHRGPDDSGQFDNGACSLAMRRLSIIDLETGHQPIHNADGSRCIVFNGEIYNYRELRKRLAASQQHRFRTQSDTEVILHLYEDEGVSTPALLHGMFAFCIYDQRDKRLFLARDRFGEKPLYYAVYNGAFAFSSEITSLLEWRALPRRLDFEALYYLLHLGYIPAPKTLFEGVFQLPPGHWMSWQNGQTTVQRYYHPHYDIDPAFYDSRIAVEALRERLLSAVKSQMISEVPLGAFLSGGIDSSTVVAAMQQVVSQPVKTFTVRFEYAPFDESPIARAVAEHLGTDHHEFVISDAEFTEEDMLRIVRHFGQPFLDSSAIPTYFITRQIRDHVTVALSGDGGDEMFAGYGFFTDSLRLDQLAAFPRPLSRLAETAVNSLRRTPGLRNHLLLRQLCRATQIAARPANSRPGLMETLFDIGEFETLISPSLRQQWDATTDRYTPEVFDAVASASRLRQLMHYRTLFSLPEDMLAKVDRMSMANSLEVRAPLLSAEISDLAMRLPDEMLINGKVKKFLLREAGRPWLPEVVYSHPKSGFTIPLHRFQNDCYAEMCRQYITGSRHPLMLELFDHSVLEAVVTRGLTGNYRAAEISVHRATHQVWGLLQLGAWAEMYDVGL